MRCHTTQIGQGRNTDFQFRDRDGQGRADFHFRDRDGQGRADFQFRDRYSRQNAS